MWSNLTTNSLKEVHAWLFYIRWKAEDGLRDKNTTLQWIFCTSQALLRTTQHWCCWTNSILSGFTANPFSFADKNQNVFSFTLIWLVWFFCCSKRIKAGHEFLVWHNDIIRKSVADRGCIQSVLAFIIVKFLFIVLSPGPCLSLRVSLRSHLVTYIGTVFNKVKMVHLLTWH